MPEIMSRQLLKNVALALTITVAGAALENEVGIRQCRPKCRPINLLGRQIFADLNLA